VESFMFTIFIYKNSFNELIILWAEIK